MTLTLVVLAAGMGSRYGGLKQVDPVGPDGATMLDYAVYDALRAGFSRIIFVIRRDFEAAFRERVGARFSAEVTIDYVFQSREDLPGGATPPPGREKPWGTGHAVWSARDAVPGNFAVINADDFYGADSFRQLSAFLQTARPVGSGPLPTALVGFRLANTLSEHGAVSRGVCSLRPDGSLESIVEQTNILATEVGPGRKFSGAEIVSMNCWGFGPEVFPRLEAQLRAFLAGRGSDPRAEFYLPAAISTLVGQGEATVAVLPTASQWFGVTYQEDKPRVKAALQALIAAGTYPSVLWR